MDSTTKIIELASQNNGIVTAAMISSAGISRGSLKYLADTGRLDQVSRGVYTLPEVWEDEFVSIQERYKRGVFALDTALFLHDLTDRTPHKFHMAFPYGYNTSSPKAAGILCSCKKEPYYSLGIALVDTPAGNTVRAYNAEKTLCEILKPISHTDIQIITDAFKRYAGRKDKNIPLLSEYAHQLRVEKRLRFLERVSLSPYRDNYIIKGGFLISSMVGLNSRATMDMDATIKGYPVTQDAVQKMIEQILTVPVDDDITFTFKSIGGIREGDEYTRYRVALTADFPPMAVPLKLDITTGDKITPREIQYDYKLMLEDRHIQVMAYNLATILAEKLETVISRSDQNTRPRDYYDVYILTKLQAENIDFPALGAALMATASKRGSDSILQDYRAIVEAVRNSEIMRRQWDNYRKDFDYASTISFDEVCDAVASTMDTLITNNFFN